MPARLETERATRSTRLLLWLERLFLVAGAAVLIGCAVIVADALIAQNAARVALETAVSERQTVLAPSLEEETEAESEDPRPDTPVSNGSPLGALSIPRVQLSAAILHGTDARTLRRGPGHLENTALPGEPGNVVIAGHRDTFFSPLRNIRVGDDIFLNTPRQRLHYRVTSLRVVKPRDLSVLASTREPTLTLITCYPFWVLGHAPDRFIVRAVPVETPTSVPFEPRPPDAVEVAAAAHRLPERQREQSAASPLHDRPL